MRWMFPLMSVFLGLAAYGAGRSALDGDVVDALSSDPVAQVRGVRALRDRGEAGLDALFEAEGVLGYSATPGQWDHAIDQVAAQRGARYSELFWHTDLERAKAQAARENKPILSLRMLGDLRDATSCANSRFFRAALYSHPDVAALLDDRFVLHWSSERAVPQVHIQFGDGRELRTTVGGNSVHYVLDPSGRPIDGIPGLYTPESFMTELRESLALDEVLSKTSANRRQAALIEHHAQAREAGIRRTVFARPTPDARGAILNRPLFEASDGVVPAFQALPMAIGKGIVESPFVVTGASVDVLEPDAIMPTELGGLHPESAHYIRSLRPAGPDATKDEVDGLLSAFEATMRADATWNRNVLHTRIHDRFAQTGAMSFDALNAFVYADVFGTPSTDPWLGLYDSNVFSGLVDGGRVGR